MCQDSLKLYLFNFKKKNLTKLGFRVRFELRLTNLKIKSPVSDIFFFYRVHKVRHHHGVQGQMHLHGCRSYGQGEKGVCETEVKQKAKYRKKRVALKINCTTTESCNSVSIKF